MKTTEQRKLDKNFRKLEILASRDPKRNMCPESDCIYVKHSEDSGVSYEKCNRCGRIKNVNHRV